MSSPWYFRQIKQNEKNSKMKNCRKMKRKKSPGLGNPRTLTRGLSIIPPPIFVIKALVGRSFDPSPCTIPEYPGIFHLFFYPKNPGNPERSTPKRHLVWRFNSCPRACPLKILLLKILKDILSQIHVCDSLRSFST